MKLKKHYTHEPVIINKTTLLNMFTVNHLHPMLVHFPIALGIIGCLFEFFELYFSQGKKQCSCGEYLLYFATFSALLALLTGNFFTDSFTGKAEEMKNIHSAFAGITFTLLCLTTGIYLFNRFWGYNNHIYHKIGFLFYCASAVSVGITGFFGGSLVYNYLIHL